MSLPASTLPTQQRHTLPLLNSDRAFGLYTCPDWCQVDHPREGLYDPEDPAVHNKAWPAHEVGLESVRVEVEQYLTDAPQVWLVADGAAGVEMTAAQVRALAADLLAAADLAEAATA